MAVKSIIGPLGRVLTFDNLPEPSTGRWVPRRKAEVVCAVRGGILTREAALSRYNISTAEYTEWESHYKSYGIPGLRVTMVQEYR